MKAFILAAGFGTRLKPYTQHTPKPLFPIGGIPLIEVIIKQLVAAGFDQIIINTHHLSRKIENFIRNRKFEVAIQTRFEPEILGTGGAIRNVADFISQDPILIMNSDIVANIDLKTVYEFHTRHSYPVTMVMHDYPAFNQVFVGEDHFVEGFYAACCHGHRKLAFTGIQVIDASVIDHIPKDGFYSSIDLYQKLIDNGSKVCAYLVRDHKWRDIGTIESYRQEVISAMVPQAFGCESTSFTSSKPDCEPLKGDGSDRRWFRLKHQNRTLVMVDHGIRETLEGTLEVDAYVKIGNHLKQKGVIVPQIRAFDTFSGLVFIEDLGDVHLQDYLKDKRPNEIFQIYKRVIDNLLKLGRDGYNDFDVRFTYQTTDYDRTLILEKECRYFVNAFLVNYLGVKVDYRSYLAAFGYLADKALEYAVIGFMHRDMQSRNVMVKENQYYFIDFQGGRRGPIQYDLASLLFDPYVKLDSDLISDLLAYYCEAAAECWHVTQERIENGVNYCAITRNLQALGAYGFLSLVKGKTDFEAYIPPAIRILRRNLVKMSDEALWPLQELISNVRLEKAN